MCMYEGKQLGPGARRGLGGDSLRASCESVLGARPCYPTMSAACTLTASEEGTVCLEPLGRREGGVMPSAVKVPDSIRGLVLFERPVDV